MGGGVLGGVSGGGISAAPLLAVQAATTFVYTSFIVKMPRHALGFPATSRKTLGWVVPAAVLYALQHQTRQLTAMTSSLTVLIVARQLVPLVTLAFERFFFNARASVAIQFCLVLTVIGVSLYAHGLTKIEATSGFLYPAGVYILIVHILSCAGANLWTKMAITAVRPDTWSLLVNFWSIPVYGLMTFAENYQSKAPLEKSLAAGGLAKAAAFISVPLAVCISVSTSRLAHRLSPTGFALLNGLLKVAIIGMSVLMGSLPPAGVAQWVGLVLAMAGGLLYAFVARAEAQGPKEARDPFPTLTLARSLIPPARKNESRKNK